MPVAQQRGISGARRGAIGRAAPAPAVRLVAARSERASGRTRPPAVSRTPCAEGCPVRWHPGSRRDPGRTCARRSPGTPTVDETTIISTASSPASPTVCASPGGVEIVSPGPRTRSTQPLRERTEPLTNLDALHLPRPRSIVLHLSASTDDDRPRGADCLIWRPAVLLRPAAEPARAAPPRGGGRGWTARGHAALPSGPQAGIRERRARVRRPHVRGARPGT